MLITDEFEVDHPIERVWEFFDDIPGVAKCLPGTELNEVMFLPSLGGLALAPLLMLASLFLASKRPGFALFSLSYLTGLIVTMMI